jgi:hypothetical protein
VEDARSAIARLIFTYADRVDRGDFEGIADMIDLVGDLGQHLTIKTGLPVSDR